jgi:hypothetical protein
MRKFIIALIIIMAAGAASATVRPLLTNNTFVYTGWLFGYSSFGTGHF